tara:strand:+ start:1804 stop:2868 length:1065 start_codon:yes stop_codon:yes gene_type:complete
MPKAKDYDANWQENKISVYRRYAEGLVKTQTQSSWGMRCGLYHKEVGGRRRYMPLLLVGPIQIGFTLHDLFVVQNQRWIFLGRDGRIWKLANASIPNKVPWINEMSQPGVVLWADSISRMVVDRLTPNSITEPLSQANQRYRFLCRQLVIKRVMDCAASGRERTMDDFAHGVSPDWTKADLASPRIPTVQHSILMCLVLGLDSDTACDMIELAAFCEHKLPLFNRQACLSIYQSSVELLAKLCPAWWNSSYMTDWKFVGSIDQLFKAQFSRIINDAWTREVPIEGIVGVPLNINDNVVTNKMSEGDGEYVNEWGVKDEDYTEHLELDIIDEVEDCFENKNLDHKQDISSVPSGS